jgi:hypothetical protein
MIIQRGEISSRSNKDSSNHNNSRYSKDDIINVTKAAAKRSILMQITARAKLANSFH